MPRFAVNSYLPGVVAAAVASLLVGCSGDQGSTAPAATSSPPPPATATTATTTAPVPATTTAPSSAAPTTTAATGTALKIGLPGFPRALADARGRAVYVFSLDNHGKSACLGACATPWPPVLTKGTPSVTGPGARPEQAGTRSRGNGTVQATYAGWPLYYFIRDQAPGQTSGVGRNVFGGQFRLIQANGDMVSGR
jgi:predicted lipoprotein with Yx(FWY)xxD motif